MYQDNTLTPKEAVRLCALGTLAGGATTYSALANSIRHFMSRVLGPSLDVMGTSVELLKYEGLIETVESTDENGDALLVITDAGRKAFRELLTANLRATTTDLNKLIIALKFRFLHLLPPADRRHQAELLVETSETELTRLIDLRQFHSHDDGHLGDWLDQEIAQLETRLSWLKNFRDGLTGEA